MIRSRMASARGLSSPPSWSYHPLGIVLGAEDRGGFLPSSVEQFQDVMLFRFRRLQQEPFINNEQDGVGILGLNLLVGAICTRQIKLQEHIGQGAHTLFYSAVCRLPYRKRKPCRVFPLPVAPVMNRFRCSVMYSQVAETFDQAAG